MTKAKKRKLSTKEEEPQEKRSPDIEDPAILERGVLNPERTRVPKNELGTEADTYKYSGYEEIPENDGTKEDPDEEDDTRLGN